MYVFNLVYDAAVGVALYKVQVFSVTVNVVPQLAVLVAFVALNLVYVVDKGSIVKSHVVVLRSIYQVISLLDYLT